MNFRAALILGLCALTAIAQDKPTQSSELPAGSMLRVMLSEPVDVESCKIGDQVRANVLGLVEGSKIKGPRYPLTLLGHITEVQSRAAGQGESRLGIAFDKLSINSLAGKARELNVSAVINRVVTVKIPPPRERPTVTVPTSGDDPVQRAAGPMVDNSGRPVYPTPPPTSQPGPGGQIVVSAYDANIQDFTVRADDSTSVTVISSKKRNVVLAPEMRLIIRVTKSGQ